MSNSNAHFSIFSLLFFMFVSFSLSPSRGSAQVNTVVPEVIAKRINSVVNISSSRIVKIQDFSLWKMNKPQEFEQKSLGSGVIVKNDGVVEGAQEVKVSLYDNREYIAHIVATDPPSDIAIIKINGNETDFSPIPFGNSDALKLGDTVIAIGNPFGLGNTVTQGIVSSLGRNTLGIEDYENFIQTDAPINPGNSGGALINLNGELVGINTAIESQSGGSVGLGFAIPTNMASQIMQKLIQNGKIIRGFLGVNIQSIGFNMANVLHIPSQGVLVSDIVPGSPAELAGIKVGDVITRLQNTNITNASQFMNLVAMSGTVKTQLTIFRNGSPLNINVTLAPLVIKSQNPAVSRTGKENLVVKPLTSIIRQELKVPANITGVVVTDITQAPSAADAGIMPGDIIREVNRTAINTVDQFNSLYNRKGDVVLYVLRKNDNAFILVSKP